eukprot:TRINITY_DN18037_c0_g1_i3.p1 TRINITY_DN18037_c0_g1~~TRINITY_DN18037_c0_g1_i3.p1  ORF type:complete len:347 (+),score=70.94 TRINITY_DN18037_c0_g1_i3:82-1122(+)
MEQPYEELATPRAPTPEDQEGFVVLASEPEAEESNSAVRGVEEEASGAETHARRPLGGMLTEMTSRISSSIAGAVGEREAVAAAATAVLVEAAGVARDGSEPSGPSYTELATPRRQELKAHDGYVAMDEDTDADDGGGGGSAACTAAETEPLNVAASAAASSASAVVVATALSANNDGRGTEVARLCPDEEAPRRIVVSAACASACGGGAAASGSTSSAKRRRCFSLGRVRVIQIGRHSIYIGPHWPCSILMLGMICGVGGFFIENVAVDLGIYHLVAAVAVTVGTVAAFLSCALADPGILRPRQPGDVPRDPERPTCGICNIVQPQGSRHCQFCQGSQVHGACTA